MSFDIQTRALTPVALVSKRADPFKRLTPEHLRILSLFLQGRSRTEIANYLNIKPVRVGVVLRNQAIQVLIDEAANNVKSEIAALQGPALDVVRGAMGDGTEPAIQLRAADMALKMNHLYDEDHSKNVTAEDVVAKLIAKRREIHIQSDGPVNVSIIEEEKHATLSK